jgi:hypothetical protein
VCYCLFEQWGNLKEVDKKSSLLGFGITNPEELINP